MRTFVRHFLFVYAVALSAIVVSERMFWYWSDRVLPQFELALFYALPTAAVLAVMRRFEVHSIWGAILAVPVFGYVTEGVITPVVYSGGPTPFFPVWFTAWHGIGAIVLGTFAVRALAIQRRRVALAGLSAAFGAFWGTWLITSLHPDQLEDPELVGEHGPLTAMTPGDFGVYAAVVTALWLGAHILIDRAWPTHPSRLLLRTEKLLAGGLLLGAATWTVAYPWALPMFVVLCWLQFRVLARHRSARGETPTWLDSFATPARLSSFLPLASAAPVAAAAYWLWWELELSDTMLQVVYFGSIGVQTLIAAILLMVAWRRVRDAARDALGEQSAGEGTVRVGAR